MNPTDKHKALIYISILQAYVEEKQIEYLFDCPYSKIKEWKPVINPTWDFHNNTYRIKPKEPIKKYLILCKNPNKFFLSSSYYKNTEEAQIDIDNNFTVHTKAITILPETMKEFNE